MLQSSRRTVVCCVLLGLVVAACAINPVTGKRELSLVSEAQEVEIGRSSDPQIVATYGLYDDPEVAAYVDAIGQKMAKLSHRSDLQFTFRVLDSPVINAFALPGGYIYVTRGILAHMNNEAELAVVLGHEIGHVTARHGARRQTNATLAGLGLGVGGALVPEVARYSAVVQQSLALLFLKYGRDDEHQADELGVEYSVLAGYDPEVGSKFFEVLDRKMQESGQSLPGWLSTHPDPGDRVQRTLELSQQRKAGQAGPWRVAEDSHKDRLEGLVFGENPRSGYVQGREFLHPDLRFAITFPAGWKIQNTPGAVLAGDAEKTAQIQMTLENGEGSTPESHITELAQAAEAKVVQSARQTIGGYTAFEALLELSAEGQTQQVLVTCIQRQPGEGIYRFLGFASSMQNSIATLRQTAGSFRALTDQRALAVEPNHVRVMRQPRGRSFGDAVASYPDVPVDAALLALLNNLQLQSPLPAGFRLKIVQGRFGVAD